MTKHVLIIEDQPSLVLILRMQLEMKGYRVTFSLNGEDGLRKAREQKPDVVLLDLGLPRMSGMIVCRHLKDDPLTRQMRVIIVSGVPANELEAMRTTIGADACISKPHDGRKLAGLITTMLEHQPPLSAEASLNASH